MLFYKQNFRLKYSRNEKIKAVRPNSERIFYMTENNNIFPGEENISENPEIKETVSESVSDGVLANENVGQENFAAENTDAGAGANAETFNEKPAENAAETKPEKQKKHKKEKQHHGTAGLWMMTVLCLVMSIASAAISIFGTMKPADNGSSDTTPPPTTVYETAEKDTTDRLTVAGVAEKVTPSVVMITADVVAGYTSGTSMGSGFFITEDGNIVTNYHVVQNATSIKITTYDGKEYSAEVLGSDSVNDIAVLKANGTGFVAAKLGDSADVKVGDQVVAIGTPYSSSLQNTVTAGYISAVRNDYRFSSLSRVLSVFQHDAAINSGNSGGPLCNMYGEVIGINSVKIAADTYENISFAIQISSVKDIITELQENGMVNRPMIGITATTDTSIGGATVVKVTSGSPAEKAGIQVGDIITKIDGQRISSTEELINYLSRKNAGDTVEVVVIRDAESMNIPVTLFSTAEHNSLTQESENANQNGQQNQNTTPGQSNGNGNFNSFFSEFFNR